MRLKDKQEARVAASFTLAMFPPDMRRRMRFGVLREAVRAVKERGRDDLAQAAVEGRDDPRLQQE